MNINDTMKATRPSFGCCFCGTTEMAHGTWACGMSGFWNNNSTEITIASVCKNYKETITSSHVCVCEIMELMRCGCKCGGE